MKLKILGPAAVSLAISELVMMITMTRNLPSWDVFNGNDNEKEHVLLQHYSPMVPKPFNSVHNRKYDVFISFRGSDIRQGFLSHLHKALLDQNIEAFVDEQLNRGEDISESLLDKIKESHISVVIYSQNYAYSEWCLKELLKIAECRNTEEQIVIPVFYGVDPTHVQNLTGSYGDAMARHRTQFDKSLVEKWGNAVKNTAFLSGLVSCNFKSESDMIEEIVKQVLDKLNCIYPSNSPCDGGLVGMDSRVEKVKSLLCGSEDVCIVGIWGEGGIGKTTLAQAAFELIRSRFDSQCFVGNVREKFEKFTADAIQNEVVTQLFGTSYAAMTRKSLSRKKVILVLDDVSDLDQIKSTIRYKVDFGCGSRIIVTSRDHHLLKNLCAKIYEVEKLNQHEALHLFCLNAFDRKVPEEGFLQLCERAVGYAQGLPLALEILGSNLFRRSAEEWEDELEKLKDTLDQKIHKILRISYDGLCDTDKEIFLDIACCFEGRFRDEVESLLDARGSKIGISRLVEKALISMSSGNQIIMHDLIQQMAKDIIREEKSVEKRRWLWDPEEVYFLLTREMGTEAVRGLSLDTSKIRNINLSPSAFRKLYNLRYLKFYTFGRDNAQICAPQGLDYLPENLRYLCWDQYPSKSLPLTNFLAEKLVELKMNDNQIEQLWSGVQKLPNLRRIDLSGSRKLIKLPDLSKASNLNVLILENCTSLVEVPSLKYLSKLIELDLGQCSRLESLPDKICNLKSLVRLDISGCENLYELPQDIGNLISLLALFAQRSGIKEIPESICNVKGCRKLDVSDCKNLHRLPQNFENLQSLECFLGGGSGIKEVPCRLNFSGYKGFTLPLTENFPHIRMIHLNDCGISEFPIGLCSMTSLTVLNLGGNNFESIPESIQNLRKLHSLDVNFCEKLKYLPESVKLLPLLSHLDMTGCTSLDQNLCSNITDHLIMACFEGRKQYITHVWHPGNEVAKSIKHKNECGSTVSFSFKLLQSVGHKIWFYICIVLDRPIYDLSVKGDFTDQSGLNFCAEKHIDFNVGMTINSKHTCLKPIPFGCKNFVKGNKYTAEFKFEYITKFSDDFGADMDGDGIIKCGIIPLFDHQTIG